MSKTIRECVSEALSLADDIYGDTADERARQVCDLLDDIHTKLDEVLKGLHEIHEALRG